MKNIARFIAIVALLGFSMTTNAQSKFKFGHINSEAILEQMPERDSAEMKFNQYAQQIRQDLEEMQVEYNKKLEKYQNLPPETTAVKRRDLEAELQSLGQRIQAYEVNAQTDIQKKQQELLQPIYEKLNKAIEKVGEDNGFIYIFEVNTLLYHSDQSVDITDMVKEKLGLQ